MMVGIAGQVESEPIEIETQTCFKLRKEVNRELEFNEICAKFKKTAGTGSLADI
jgi:hypothetical protein